MTHTTTTGLSSAGAVRPLRERIGIVQGRLVPSSTGELQCSPGERWRDEFVIASDLGLNHIELVAERFVDDANPIWSESGRRDLGDVMGATGVTTPALCVDETLDRPIEDPDFVRDLTDRLIPAVRDLRVETVVLPVFEASHLPAMDLGLAAAALAEFSGAVRAHGARVVLELGVPAFDGVAFIDTIPGEEIGVCYDTGNATTLGFDVLAELAMLGDRVWHVHAKDKDRSGQNVRFGAGIAPLTEALSHLAAVSYPGLITMEATRGENPVVTAAQHRDFLLTA